MRPTPALSQSHVHVKSPYCGDLIEIVHDNSSAPDIAVLMNVERTTAHFHDGFDETYFVLDGDFNVRLFDPDSGETTDHVLSRHEACVIPRRVHHKITSASAANRLCVVCVPHFNPKDEVLSNII